MAGSFAIRQSKTIRALPETAKITAHRKSDQRRDDLCADGLRKRALAASLG